MSGINIRPEVVKGVCPTCTEDTMLVSLTNDYYRCIECGSDLQQHINGKISYLPVLTYDPSEGSPIVKQWDEES